MKKLLFIIGLVVLLAGCDVQDLDVLCQDKINHARYKLRQQYIEFYKPLLKEKYKNYEPFPCKGGQTAVISSISHCRERTIEEQESL